MSSYNLINIKKVTMHIKEVQEKLRRIKNINISQGDIAKAIDTTRSNVSQLFSKNSILSEEKIRKIEEFFGVNLSEEDNFLPENFIKIPYYENLKIKKDPTYIFMPDFSKSKPKAPLAIKVDTDSMAPYINKGDLAVFDGEYRDIEDGRVFLIKYRGDFFIKRILNNLNSVILKSDNKDYNDITQDIRARLLKLAHADNGDYTTVLMQGSGTFGVESVLTSIPSKDDVVLVLVNGAYSKRMLEILTYQEVKFEKLEFAYNEIPDAAQVAEFLDEHPEITIISMVHSETTSGLLNNIEAIGKIAKERNLLFIVDAMSSFGGVDINVPELGIDFIVSSANKCIQGVPGFSFVVANKKALEQSCGNARSLSLDLYAQYLTMEKDGGKWRFTSPTHVVAAFHQALIELDKEGGINERHTRYQSCNQALREGMQALGINT